MTVIDMDVRPNKRDFQPNLKLDKGTRDSLADYCKHRWPCGTAKLAAREWGLTLDEGQGVAKGRASFTTWDKIKKAGGWPVILSVEAAVVGHGIDQFLAHIGASNHEHGRRVAALFGGGGALAPDPGPPDSDADLQSRHRRRA